MNGNNNHKDKKQGKEGEGEKDFNKKNYQDRGQKSMVPDGSGLLLGHITQVYKEMYKDHLDLLEQVLIITTPDKEKKEAMYTQLRAKVLRIGNNALRSMSDEFRKYSIRPKRIVHDIIVPPERIEEVKAAN